MTHLSARHDNPAFTNDALYDTKFNVYPSWSSISSSKKPTSPLARPITAGRVRDGCGCDCPPDASTYAPPGSWLRHPCRVTLAELLLQSGDVQATRLHDGAPRKSVPGRTRYWDTSGSGDRRTCVSYWGSPPLASVVPDSNSRRHRLAVRAAAVGEKIVEGEAEAMAAIVAQSAIEPRNRTDAASPFACGLRLARE